MRLSLSRIAELVAADAISAGFDPQQIPIGYSIDSRTVRAGELFFAVRGERLDGHDFVPQALAKGAVAAVVSRESFSPVLAACGGRTKLDGQGTSGGLASPPPPLMAVEDTLLALQILARAVRQLWGRSLIAVTGSVGKTTTKESIAHLLATRFQVHKSEGNFNNHFGLPLMLLKLKPEHDVAVVEMGMSHLGEITALAQIALPETGVVTNVAPVHLEFFSSVAEIARAKYELIESLPATGTAVLNADDPYVSQFGRSFGGKVITYGVSPLSGVKAENFRAQGTEGSSFDLVVVGHRERVRLSLAGRHNVGNALAAVAVALESGLSLGEAIAALASLEPADKRGQVVRIGNIQVINDCYNSNPKALAAMVDLLASMPAERRIVVAGEMLELGPEGNAMHFEAGEYMADQGINLVLGVRGLAEKIVEGAKERGRKAEFVSTPEDAGRWLARETRQGDVVLLKGSRGVKLERALEAWKQELSAVSGGKG